MCSMSLDRIRLVSEDPCSLVITSLYLSWAATSVAGLLALHVPLHTLLRLALPLLLLLPLSDGLVYLPDVVAISPLSSRASIGAGRHCIVTPMPHEFHDASFSPPIGSMFSNPVAILVDNHQVLLRCLC